MSRLLGVLGMVIALYLILVISFPYAGSADNTLILSRRLGFYGVLTLGVGILIISGGIDLSIGSLVALSAVLFSKLLGGESGQGIGVVPAALLTVAAGAGLGVLHGLLVTWLRLQPFLVTLCGLFIYRGLARYWTKASIRLPDDRPDVEWLRTTLVSGNDLGPSNQLLLLLVLAGALAVLLHGTVHGRYLYAIGFNEQAARYAGIRTNLYKVLAYVICSAMAGLGGVLFLLEVNSAQPTSAGSLLELYAITGAVLGGCSLRGGEGTIAGMLLGAAVLPLLAQICNLSKYIGSDLEYTVIGGALLLGTIGNEVVERIRAYRARK